MQTTIKNQQLKNAYYSGIIALNLFPDDINGDWHSAMAINALKNGISKSPYFIMGIKGKLSTKKYFGSKGIVDISKTLKNIENTLGITKAAKPYRAVADMVLISLLSNKKTDHIQISDWLVADDELLKFKDLLIEASKKMNFEEKEKLMIFMHK